MKPILIVQNCAAESAGTVPEYLERRGIPFHLMRSDRGDLFPKPSSLHAIVNLGCPLSVVAYDRHDFLRKLYAFVAASVRADIPYLGICFGGQLLARILGAAVKPNTVKEIGTCTVRLSEHGRKDRLFDGFDDQFPVLQWHGDTFNVPFGSSPLVEGDACRNQAFRVGRMVAVQFHLETRSEDLSHWCDTYAHELAELRLNRDKVLGDFADKNDTIRTLNFRLLDNFLHIADNPH